MTGGKVIPKDSQAYKNFLASGNVEDLLDDDEVLEEDDETTAIAEEETKTEPVSPYKMTREDQFKYYAARRVNAILRELQRLGAMSNTYSGHYDKKAVGTIFYALEKGVRSTKDMYVNIDALSANFSFK